MQSWNIIGWIILILGALFVLVTFVSTITVKAIDWARWRRTRTVQPERGQIWTAPDGSSFYVMSVGDDRVTLSTAHPRRQNPLSVTWSDTRARWDERHRAGRFYLTDNWSVQ